MSDKLQIKQISGKPAVKYSDIEPGVVFTFNDGTLYGDSAYLKTYEGRLHLVDFRTPHSSVAEGTLCTVYISTLTMEV